jgi:hypothetical protein
VTPPGPATLAADPAQPLANCLLGGQLPLINELSVALKPERFLQAHFEP